MSKIYKGEIGGARIVRVPIDIASKYPTNLGYIFQGNFVNHPKFRGLDAIGGTTSLVVKYDRKTGDVETLNSRYKLIYDDNVLGCKLDG